MDNNYFIDKKTFQVYEDYPLAFNCDRKIAKIIAKLNSLGYQTKSSCEGHLKYY